MKYFALFITTLLNFSAVAQPAWQQRVDTRIDVRLDDRSHYLHAYEELTYFNNSPDTLHFIYMHLWPNAYQHDHTPYARQLDENRNTTFYYSKAADKGYIDSLQFTVDGQTAEYNIAENTPDIARIELATPMLPGAHATISTPFRVKIPKVFSRLGHSGQAYYISQWFPKPAVYDQKGWHPISYLELGEFYSEYGNYDVYITLPSNYVLMATGNCMDEKESAWLDGLSQRPLPGKESKSPLSDPDTAVTSSETTKTVYFHETNVHDFAWFADKRWLVQKDTVSVPGTNQLVTTWSAFLPSFTQSWKNSNTWLKETIKYYSKWVGPYPYKTIKAVQGDMKAGGGMEYPTITIIDRSARPAALQIVTVHEAGHNWFYGMLGSNERDHAWMDEGINTFYEQKTNRAIDHDSSKTVKTFDENLVYNELAATHLDQPIEQTSSDFNKLTYGIDVYYKTAMMLRWMEHYIGEEAFGAGMKDYFDKWHYHHPYPEDFRACMQKHTDRSLNWFFDTLLTSAKKIDYTITKAKTIGNNTEITVRNNTGVFAPVLVDALNRDSVTSTAWSVPFTGKTTVLLPGTGWTRLKIDDVIPDSKPANDVYRRHAIFHHFGIKVKPFAGLNVSDKDKVFVSLAAGNNLYDGFMAGLTFHNLTLPENRFRFAIAPMYSFATNTLTGAGSAAYIWYPQNLFHEIMLQADAKTFHYNETLVNLPEPMYARYIKVAPSLRFTFDEHDALSTVTRSVLLKAYHITENGIDTGAGGATIPVLKTEQKIYGLVRYEHANDRVYNPFSYRVEYHGNNNFGKLTAEGDIRIDYNTKDKALYVRGFIGKYFAWNTDPALTDRYQLNSTFTGPDDYLYDGTYKGRNATDGIGAQQVSIQEGGFKVPTGNHIDRSDNWMATMNLSSNIPGKIKLPVKLFFDAGLIPNFTPDFKHSGSTTLIYDGGIELIAIKDIVSIYFPIILSSDYQNYLTNTYGRKNVFGRSISFTLQLQNINWLKVPGRLLKVVN